MASDDRASQLVQQLLTNPTVRIKDTKATTEKLSTILQDGRPNLHFICDFDMTMSRYYTRNKDTGALQRNPSCHGVPSLYSKMDPKFKITTDNLLNTYYPIEIHKEMTREQKLPYMIEWWQKAHAAMSAQKITRDDIRGMAEETPVELRPGIDTVLELCYTRALPFLVFSAGIGNIIDEILKEHKLMFPNMHIVSNMMKFDEQGVCVDFEEPLIHVFNKSEFQLENTPYYKTIKDRANVILIGDSEGDLQMSQGVKHNLCLNIGFCNHDCEALEPKYTEKFDIVIMGDADFNPVIDILECLG
ncbi:pyrimidine 5'-nucleotidase [Zychaea mexicana]|uniref:pyrimidine 5'-nucleotidase n=1 Tax=Zychaea mexicana TaxID=64656 RepID=UPI0022FF1630|nr:pyrimidine 5'-nucleotidase [Zychaea mexicana]KAI9490106.1 pyrimidine 5'-nucleotidase [Zychaea mexicana]